ncbi:MAG: hypothetical protein Q9191_005503 [Dirinaria sp. TL-2023a]
MAENPAVPGFEPTNAEFEASATALSALTTSAEHHGQDPKSALHRPSSHDSSHTWLSKILPSSTLEAMETRFHMGNYVVIDRNTGEKEFEPMSIYVRVGMHLLFYGSQQEKILQWKETENILKAQSIKMGEEYDAPESKAHIESFIDSFDLRPTLPEYVEPDPSKYPNFNAFFAREIRADARPIADPSDARVISSPADCRLTGFPTIDLATRYWIKGFGFTVAKLLGDDKALAQTFEGGSIVIARLAPQDYHRWHAPTDGTVLSVKDVDGTYYTVNPQAINQPGTLDVFCENRRSVMTVQNQHTQFAIVAIGAMLVGSIKYVNGVENSGTEISRGQCLGAFYYGGSTVVVLYPRGMAVLDDDIVRNSTGELPCETLVKVGEKVGTLTV